MLLSVDQADYADIIARAVKHSMVLLGETHVNADHHRWQLQVLAAMHAVRSDMVIGFEMFSRCVQAVLDRWVAGELDKKAYLAASEWNRVRNTDPQLYLPLFHFARMNRVPMVALNIELKLRRQVYLTRSILELLAKAPIMVSGFDLQ